jgi:hypothetical protein
MTGEHLAVLIDNGNDGNRHLQCYAHVFREVVKLLASRPLEQAGLSDGRQSLR